MLFLTRTVSAATLAVLFSKAAFAFCMEPTAPSAAYIFNEPAKPTTPYCVNTFTNTHTCSDWEIRQYNSATDTYNRQVSDYVMRLRAYVDQADNFADNAVDYAKCKMQQLE